LVVVFCLPGRSYSGRFLECWSDLLASCYSRGVTPLMRREYTSNVYLARNMILKPDILLKGFKTRDARPLEGSEYDWLMWIDSDAVFNTSQFWRLVKYNVDIVAGSAITNMEQGKVSWGMFNKDGSCEFCKKDDFGELKRDEQGLFEVDFTGFHWILIKRGVFEKIEYPWFQPITKKIGENIYFPSEDIGWSMRAREAGFKIMVDPECKIGHEKPVTLMP
jgi:GT2 family glycosyltransferase